MQSLPTTIFKHRAVGWSWIAPRNPRLQLLHLLFQLPKLTVGTGREADQAVLVGQVTLVQNLEAPAEELEKTSYVEIIHQRFTDIVDLSAGIFTARVGQEENVLDGKIARGEVVEKPVVILPNSVELCLDKDIWPFPNGPARQLFATMSDHVLWHDAETFQCWLTEQRLIWNKDGRVGYSNCFTEGLNVL